MNTNNFKLTKDTINYYKNLGLKEKESLYNAVAEMYHAFGQLLVRSYLDSPEYVEQNWQMADGENPDIVEAKILENPYRIHIFVNQIPEHIKTYMRVLPSSKERNYFKERQRWSLIMNTAFRELKRQGVQPFKDKAVAIYKFHFTKTGDADNYAVRILNNAFRDVGLIWDDSIHYLATYCDGLVNPDNPGVEITLLRQADFAIYYQEVLQKVPVNF